MLRKSQLSVAISAALGLTTLTVLPAQAQESADDLLLEEVVVTGSRIQRANLVSASPVTQIDAQELQFMGTMRVEDMLRTMPQVYSEQNASQQNGAPGTATINLRNLGPERTLVLINSRRMPAGSPLDGATGSDINQIPGALIKRVEILTGGASAAYGADAVAGVVNFLMIDDFEGVKLDYQYSGYQHDNDNSRLQRVVKDAGFSAPSGNTSDGETDDVSFIIGANTDNGRGNVTAYATYRKIDSVLAADRDYSACALSDDLDACFGSPTIAEGLVTDFVDFGGPGGFDYMVQGDEFLPWDGRTFNYGGLNYQQAPDKRYTLGSFAHFEINKHVDAYSELMYMNDRSVRQVAPSGNFFVTDTLECGNAFFSDQQFEALCGQFGLTKEDTQLAYVGRRNVEGGNRQDDLEYNSFRGVFGLRGDINDTWRYDGYYMYSKVNFNDTFYNDLSTPNIVRSLDAVEDPETGEIVCQSVVDGSDPACVPWNVFETGGVTQEALDYLTLPLFARGETEQEVASFYVEGDLTDYGVKLPWADNGIAVVVGAEYRKETTEYNPDNGYALGLGAGQGGAQPPISGDYSVNEFFVEASIPLVEGKRFMEQVVLDASYRYSDYDYGEETDTYGFRVGWSFNDQIKARASYQRAVRAPNVQELFLPQGLNLFGMVGDPCSGPVTGGLSAGGYTQAECARSGVSAQNFGGSLNNPAGQYNFLQGGNPDLSPEESDTYSAGIVWTPDFVDGLSLTVDYFDIEINDGINNLTPEFVLTECLEGDDAQCTSVQRGGRNDNLWVGSNVDTSGKIVALNDNFAVERVKGIDLVGSYDFDVGSWGSMNLHNVMSYIDTWDQQELASSPEEDCAGSFGGICGSPTPDLRNNLRATWTTPWNVTTSLQWRYISEVDDVNNIRDLDQVDYFDLSAIWDINEWASVRAGVNNLTDEEPPLVGADNSDPSIFGAANTFPGMYDALGRYWFVGASIGF
jgi:outer membrane receptor protein involved in Fe transport